MFIKMIFIDFELLILVLYGYVIIFVGYPEQFMM